MDLASLYPGYNRFNKSFDVLTRIGALSDDDAMIRALAPIELPLSAAVRLGNIKLCWTICKAGADPNKHGLTTKTRLPENSGSEASQLVDLNWKPLLMALMHSAYTTATILLAYGADVTSKTPPRKRTKYNKYSIKNCGTTALHVVVQDRSENHSGVSISLNTGANSSCPFCAVGHPEHGTLKDSELSKLTRFPIEQWQKTESYKKRVPG
jgi:hypothetical protein